MSRVTTTGLLALCALLSAGLVTLVLEPLQSTEGLDNDLAKVAQELKQASEEAERYTGGLLKRLIEIRVQTLKQTETMLEQKRASILRGLKLSYTISGVPYAPANETQLAAITRDIQRADQKLKESKERAAVYSGGLLQSMALVTVQTDSAAISQLWLKYYSARYGLPIFVPDGAEAKKPDPPGTVVKDKDAL